MSAPMTHATWNRVSNRANARPRAACRDRRAAAGCRTRGATMPHPPRPRGSTRQTRGRRTASVPTSTTDAVTSNESAIICSSRSARRSGGPTRFPTKPPMMAIVAATPSANEVALERERGEERQEPHGAAHHGHGAAGQQDARLVQLLPFELRLLRRLLDPDPWDLRRHDPAHDEHHRREPQRPLGPEQLLHEERGPAAHRRRDHAHEREPASSRAPARSDRRRARARARSWPPSSPWPAPGSRTRAGTRGGPRAPDPRSSGPSSAPAPPGPASTPPRAPGVRSGGSRGPGPGSGPPPRTAAS